MARHSRPAWHPAWTSSRSTARSSAARGCCAPLPPPLNPATASCTSPPVARESRPITPSTTRAGCVTRTWSGSRVRRTISTTSWPRSRAEGRRLARGVEALDERTQRAGGDRGAQAGHQALVMAQVVRRGELATEDFVATVEVAQVGARVTAGASHAVAALLDHPRVRGIHGIADAQRAAGGEQETIARI